LSMDALWQEAAPLWQSKLPQIVSIPPLYALRP
jgi:hypothetical protein